MSNDYLLTDCLSSKTIHTRARLSGRNVHANILSGWKYVSALRSLPRNPDVLYGDLAESLGKLEGRSQGGQLCVMPHFRVWEKKILDLQDLLLRAANLGFQKTVLIDTTDQTSSLFISAPPEISIIYKGQICVDKNEYSRAVLPGAPFQRWCVEKMGWSDGNFRFTHPMRPGDLSRLRLGWTFGLGRFYMLLAFVSTLFARNLEDRKFDLHARFPSYSSSRDGTLDYYTGYRRFCAETVNKLSKNILCTENGSTTRRKYYEEMLASKVVFSPFGWGEVCFRDFEAAACGCVLIKPDMSHLKTYPDIYEDGVTYIAVKWDLSDLADKLVAALSTPNRCKELAENLKGRYLKYFKKNQFYADYNTDSDV